MSDIKLPDIKLPDIKLPEVRFGKTQMKQVQRLGKNLQDILYSEDYRKALFQKKDTGNYNPNFLDDNNETPLDTLVVPVLRMLENKTEKVKPVDQEVDLDKYEGKWYEIARLPTSFQKDSYNVTAEYTQKRSESGKLTHVEVINTATRRDGSENKIVGTATPSNDKKSRLDVTFFWPFTGGYNIIELGPVVEGKYSYAVVSGDDKNMMWILSRSKTVDSDILSGIMTRLSNKGYDLSNLIMSKHL